MRMKGKKVIFDIKDTWSLDATLKPVIHAGLLKFKEVITAEKNKKYMGVPSKVLSELYLDGGDIDKHTHSGERLGIAGKEWLVILDKMIYAFGNNEPDLKDYKYDLVSGKEDGMVVEGYVRWDKVPDNEEEYNRYKKDMHAHEEAVLEGLELFGKYYTSLWW